jgi:hypothetical protein
MKAASTAEASFCGWSAVFSAQPGGVFLFVYGLAGTFPLETSGPETSGFPKEQRVVTTMACALLKKSECSTCQQRNQPIALKPARGSFLSNFLVKQQLLAFVSRVSVLHLFFLLLLLPPRFVYSFGPSHGSFPLF